MAGRDAREAPRVRRPIRRSARRSFQKKPRRTEAEAKNVHRGSHRAADPGALFSRIGRACARAFVTILLRRGITAPDRRQSGRRRGAREGRARPPPLWRATASRGSTGVAARRLSSMGSSASTAAFSFSIHPAPPGFWSQRSLASAGSSRSGRPRSPCRRSPRGSSPRPPRRPPRRRRPSAAAGAPRADGRRAPPALRSNGSAAARASPDRSWSAVSSSHASKTCDARPSPSRKRRRS